MMAAGDAFGDRCAPDEITSTDPMALLGRWLPGAEDAAPPLMALSTIGADGYPRVRHVLLSEFDGHAIYFHTDKRSAKVSEIDATPKAAASVAWPEVGRQVVLHGDLRVAGDDEAVRAYRARSRYLQLLAWLNDADAAHLPVAERHRRWRDFDVAHPVLDPPENWIGYALTPREITFWRGDPDGPSQRVRYLPDGTSWHREVLPG